VELALVAAWCFLVALAGGLVGFVRAIGVVPLVAAAGTLAQAVT